MSMTGEIKNTIGLLSNLFAKFKVSKFKMSYLYMRRSYRRCGFDLKMPRSPYLQWLYSYKKIVQVLGDYIARSYIIEVLREHCLGEK